MLKHKMLLTLLLTCVIAGSSTKARAELSFHLKATDESGKKVDRFEVLHHTYEHGYTTWREGPTLHGLLGSEEAACHRLIVRAEGYVPEILRFEHPKGTIEKEIVLRKGRRELILNTADGRAIPAELEPMVVFSEFEDLALMSYQNWSRGRGQSDLNMTSLVKIEEGRYEFHISDNSQEFFVFIDYPGFLRAFRSGPYSAKDLKNNQLMIELPQPGTIEARFEQPKDWIGELPFKTCGMRICWNKPGTNTGYTVTMVRTEEPHLEIEQDYFMPGDYWISFYTMPAKNNSEYILGQINPGVYRDMEEFSLAEGQSKSFVFEYTPYDANNYKGERNATLTVRWLDGQAAAGEPYSLYYEDIHYGSALIEKGTLNGKGQIQLVGVNDKKNEAYFTLLIREGILGRFLIRLDGEQKNGNLEFTLAPIEGQKAPNITLQDVFSNEEVNLSGFRGQVVFLEFWSVFCGPCQSPMASLCELQNNKKADWEGKAVLLAVSMDDKKEILVDHVKNRGWLDVRHLWCHEGKKGFKSKPAVTYGISGVPTALLIDKNGNIVWRGHPASVDIGAKIDELLRMCESLNNS